MNYSKKSTELSESAKNEIDFIPRFGITNDFTKISNSNAAQPGDFLVINNLLNIIETAKGTNKEFPSIGLAQEFAKLSHLSRDELEFRLDFIKNELEAQTGLENIQVTYELKNPENPKSDIIVKIYLEDLPGAIKVSNDRPSSVNSTAISVEYAE